mgnify:CR=1 FL=1|jgi:hypothetical protein
MTQLFFLEIVYLLLGSFLLLSDSYGVRYPVLLSLRHQFRMNPRFRFFLILIGCVLMTLSVFLPYDPGPPLLGDLLVTLNLLFLVVWFLVKAKKVKGEETVFVEASQYVEKNMQVFGFLTMGVAVIHFLVPMSVLL